MPTVRLGNESAVEPYRDEHDALQHRPLPGRRVTTIHVPPDRTVAEAFQDITHPNGVWAYHGQPGSKPSWAESDSPALELLLRAHFGCGARPDGWTEGGWTP